MFTGLVEAKGTLVRRSLRSHGPSGGDARLLVSGEIPGEPLTLGESIAVEGCCLTVAAIGPTEGASRSFEADASAETLAKTTLGRLDAGARVNLERAARLGARMGGHIVSGHVDGVGSVISKEPLGAALKVTFQVPDDLAKFVAPKGSIAISGVSLTVNGVAGSRFDVVLVPHTRQETTLDALAAGTPVNVEVDLLARYVLRILEAGRTPDADAVWLDRLTKAGYV